MPRAFGEVATKAAALRNKDDKMIPFDFITWRPANSRIYL